jgi:excisionase family DNA binding protein
VTIARMSLHDKRVRFARLMTADDHWLNNKMLRSGEVALLLQVSRRTVADWARAGIVPFIVTPGGHRRFRARDVRELADEMHATLCVEHVAGG